MSYARELESLFSADVRLIRTPNLSVASSELRRRVSSGETIRYQVPEAVRIYIANNHLYEKQSEHTEDI